MPQPPRGKGWAATAAAILVEGSANQAVFTKHVALISQAPLRNVGSAAETLIFAAEYNLAYFPPPTPPTPNYSKFERPRPLSCIYDSIAKMTCCSNIH